MTTQTTALQVNMASNSSNLRRYARDVATRLGLPRFWRWWMGELAPLVPAGSLSALKRWRMRPIIELTEREAIFWRPEIVNNAVELAALAKVALTGEGAEVATLGRAGVAAVTSDAQGQASNAPKVLVALPERHVMRKTLTLPAAIEENLREALSYDLDRHTPFRADQLYFDAVVVSRDAASKTIRVDWVAALKTIVDNAKRQAEGWGAIVQAVVPGPASTRVSGLNLLPVEARSYVQPWRRWQIWVPLALVAAIAIAAVVVPLMQKREYAIALMKETDDAHMQALGADAVRTQLERLQADYNYALTRKYAYPSGVETLDGITRVLPDDTWLTQLEMKTTSRGKEIQRDIVLRGESANAGKLIALLEDSKLFQQAALRSSTTKVQPGPGEIFDLGAQIKKLPPPAAVPLSAVPDAAPAAQPAQSLPQRAPAVQAQPAGVVPLPLPARASPSATGPGITPAPQSAVVQGQPAFPTRKAAQPKDEGAAASEGGKAGEPAADDDD